MNSEQLSMWFDAYCKGMLLYARNWLPEHAAHDAVQVAFVRLMEQAVPPRDVKAWLFRTVRNEAITCLRKQQRRQDHGHRLACTQVPWFESHTDDLLDARLAQDLLLTLPEVQREVVLLRIWGQFSLKQIAHIVKRPISTVHSRYQAALAHIKERMLYACKTKTD